MDRHPWIGRSNVEFVENHRRKHDLTQFTSGFHPNLTKENDSPERNAGYTLYTDENGMIYRIETDEHTNCKCILEYPDNDFSQLRVECKECYEFGETSWTGPSDGTSGNK